MFQAAPDGWNAATLRSVYALIEHTKGLQVMPLLLWFLGVPLSLVVILWLFHVI
jgi:hypothetical protein